MSMAVTSGSDHPASDLLTRSRGVPGLVNHS